MSATRSYWTVYEVKIALTNIMCDKFLMQKMDFGYHTSLTQTVNIHNTATSCLLNSDQDRLDAFVCQSRSIIAAHDNAHFENQYQKLFVKPEDFEFQPHKGDEVSRNHM